jgi:homoserine dehydrogenase
MRHYRLALLGFGNVGKALSKLLLNKQEELTNRFNLIFSVTGIATAKHGVAIDPMGLDLSRALVVDDLGSLTRQPTPRDSCDFIRRCGANVLFENTPVNYETGQPAIDHLRVALESGIHVITANKGPVVHGYQKLKKLAEVKGRKFYYESTVMDGAPIFSLFRESLPGANLLSIHGVLNSTTNLIFSLMEQGESFDESIKYCQKIGIAETDPSGDIDGYDAAIKLAVLTMVLMDFPLKLSEVKRTGIREIGSAEINQAQSLGKRWKLVCHAERKEDGVEAWVSPEMIEPDSPLYHVQGTSSVVQFETDVLGLLTIIESDPGPQTTAYGLFADFLNIVSNHTL